MGKKPTDRLKTLLGKLHSITNSKKRGSKISKEAEALFNKFVKQLEKIFKNLPKPLEWRSFYNHDLPILMNISEEVQKVSIQKGLNRSQTRALETLKEVSSELFQRVTACAQRSLNSEMVKVQLFLDRINMIDRVICLSQRTQSYYHRWMVI